LSKSSPIWTCPPAPRHAPLRSDSIYFTAPLALSSSERRDPAHFASLRPLRRPSPPKQHWNFHQTSGIDPPPMTVRLFCSVPAFTSSLSISTISPLLKYKSRLQSKSTGISTPQILTSISEKRFPDLGLGL
jgi:hypothetical protein